MCGYFMCNVTLNDLCVRYKMLLSYSGFSNVQKKNNNKKKQHITKTRLFKCIENFTPKS